MRKLNWYKVKVEGGDVFAAHWPSKKKLLEAYKKEGIKVLEVFKFIETKNKK